MRVSFYGIMAAAIALAVQIDSKTTFSQVGTLNELDVDAEVDTGLQAVSEADLQTYAYALTFAEAGSEAIVINQV